MTISELADWIIIVAAILFATWFSCQKIFPRLFSFSVRKWGRKRTRIIGLILIFFGFCILCAQWTGIHFEAKEIFLTLFSLISGFFLAKLSEKDDDSAHPEK